MRRHRRRWHHRTLTSTASIGGTLTKTYDGTTAATGATIASGTVLGAVAGDTLAFSNGSLALNCQHLARQHRHHH
ncbi:MAG: hypothetical protein IPO38_11325 [Rhodocyclaceae bacterium]|nr:hypothetical protein [Rhodocyclaceae bacterium]